MHWSSHVPLPDAAHEQFFVQSARVHRALLSHCMVHPFPAHDRSTDPDESDVTVQPPCGHEKVHGPLPSQRKSQPAAGQVSVHGSDVTHWQIWPGVQLVELLVAVVATHAASAKTSARKPTDRSMVPDVLTGQYSAARSGPQRAVRRPARRGP
jgi:hypothetical protein